MKGTLGWYIYGFAVGYFTGVYTAQKVNGKMIYRVLNP